MEAFTIRLQEADAAAVQQEANAKKITAADVIRSAVREHIAVEEVPRVLPLIEIVLEKHLDSIRAMIFKTFVMAGIGAWEGMALVGDLTDISPHTCFEESRDRALVDWRSKGVSEWCRTDEQYDPPDAPKPEK